jgi:spore coat protein H
MNRFLSLFLRLTGVVVGLAASSAQAADAPATIGLKPADIFQTTNLWTVHLTFTPEQWDAMEPKQGPRPQRARGAGSMLLGPEGGRNGILSAFGMTFNYVHAALESGTNKFADVGVRYKGNGTFMTAQNTLKRSLKIDLNQYVKGQKLGGMSQLNLHNSVRDPSFMNEAVAYRLFRDGGVPASRTAYARVFVTVPGKHERKYFGLYDLVEDVSPAFLRERFGTSKGALFKPVTPSLFSDLGDDWKNYNQTYDPKDELSDADKQRVIGFAKIVSQADDTEFAAKLPEYIDLDNLARYLAITTWLCDLDGILGVGQNYYLWLQPDTRKFSFIPWDQDQTFGQFPRGSTEEQRENLSIHRPWSGDNRFLERLFKTDAFQKAYLARLQEFNDFIFKPDRLGQQVDELATVLRPLVQEESSAQLAELNRAVAGERVTTYTGPVSFGTQLVKPIKSFAVARAQSVSDQLAGKSQGQTINAGFGAPGSRPDPGAGRRPAQEPSTR